MATKVEPDGSPTPSLNQSDGEEQEQVEEEVEEDVKPSVNDVSDILKRLQSSGALIKKPKQEYHCYTCDEDFINWEELEQHLIQHVSLPLLILNKLSDDEDAPQSDYEWSGDEDDSSPPKTPQKAPQKVDISQILNKTGISIKKPADIDNANADSALNKLSGLGFTIKKNTTPIKTEKPELENQKGTDVLQKLGQLGGIKLKLKCDNNKANSFKVVNGLRDFKASDDEDDEIDKDPDESDEDHDEADEVAGEHDSDNEQQSSRKTSESERESDSDKQSSASKNIANIPKNLAQHNTTPVKVKAPLTPVKQPITQLPIKQGVTVKPRPNVKQTPKRSVLQSAATKEMNEKATDQDSIVTTTGRRASETSNTENVVVKQEVDNDVNSSSTSTMPLFAGQVKTERASPPPTDHGATPLIATVKTEPETSTNNVQPIFQNQNSVSSTTAPPALLPITKTEDTVFTVIEINGDSNDEDDDCCVVSATPAPDVKPIIPKSENPPTAYVSPVSYSAPHSTYSSVPVSSSQMPIIMSTEKQHNFNWNAPDSKPPLDMLEKTTDDIFESLLSCAKKENNLSEASEYISLDTLGPQHSCDVCNTRFTSIGLLEEHKKMTGHSMSLVAPSNNLLPYNPTSGINPILQSLLPMKQLAEQVGKLSGSGTGPGFTHQQNVMINIQAYPGGAGVGSQPYNAYAPGQNMHSGFPQAANMFSGPGQPMTNQYGQSYMGSQGGYGSQYPPSMSTQNYPGAMPQNAYTTPTSSPYSNASAHPGMPPPYSQSSMTSGMSPNHPYVSSPSGSMKLSSNTSGIKIQNVQTFAPGQLVSGPGQGSAPGAMGQAGNQMPPPGPIRMAASANMSGPRPRMQNVRNARPSIRPGVQVQGQIRGVKPGTRMPLKRPGIASAGPGVKRRPDMLLPGKHDNDDCHVMAMQKQRDGLPMIHSVQGAKDKLNLGSQISVTKKPVNKEANAMANVLASRGISIKQKQRSRSPTPERPLPHIPNLGAGVSIKHTSKSSNFSIPESKVGSGMFSCKMCKNMFMSRTSLSAHMATAHPQSKYPGFKCEDCPASYPTSLQLQHHKRVFHNVTGPNRELGLPVVDLSQEENLKRLSNLGIYSFIPLANREQPSGCFAIPIISVHNMQQGMTRSLQALGADGLLSLGPMKPLPNT